jgi:fructose-bisphosphate aldolase class II
MSSEAEKLKNNKSIAILDAAEKGGYGIVSVVCVCSLAHTLKSY